MLSIYILSYLCQGENPDFSGFAGEPPKSVKQFMFFNNTSQYQHGSCAFVGELELRKVFYSSCGFTLDFLPLFFSFANFLASLILARICFASALISSVNGISHSNSISKTSYNFS